MPIRMLLVLLLFALAACDDDTTGPKGVPGPSAADRALDLQNSYHEGPIVAPGSATHFDAIHQNGVVSIEVWLELLGFANNFATICANQADGSEAGFTFGIDARDAIDNRRLRLTITDENGNVVVDAEGSPGLLGFGPWRHIVVVSDGTDVRFSIDGVEEIVTPTFANLGSTAPASRDLSVGSSATDVGDTFRLRARMDELRIWSQARTPTQLDSFDDAPLPASVYEDPGSGLLAYWPFDTFESLTSPSDGTDDLRDRSTHGVHLDTPSEVRLRVSGAFVGEDE